MLVGHFRIAAIALCVLNNMYMDMNITCIFRYVCSKIYMCVDKNVDTDMYIYMNIYLSKHVDLLYIHIYM